MFENIVILLMKYLMLSAALFGIYLLLFKERASFRACRFYLLLIPLISIGGAVISLDLIKVNEKEPIGKIIANFHQISEHIADISSVKQLFYPT
ncbi:MAG: hypothetical protein R3Y50_07150 [Rikenellaceae bacterium]